MKKLHNTQSGFVMLTAMVFLLVLTILALTAVRRATQGENIAKNLGEQNIAFQAAETALRYCQKEIELTLAGDNQLPPGTVQTIHGIPILKYQGTYPLYPLPEIWRNRANWVAQGFRLPSNTIEKVSAQPECMIEEWRKPLADRVFKRDNAGTGTISAFVTTVRAQGINGQSVVWLQQTWYPAGS